MNKQHIAAQLLLRAWPFPRGAGKIVEKYFSNLSFDDEIAVVPTTDSFDISVFPNDLIGRHLYLTGEFDRTTVEVLCNFAETGDTLLDIGANIGYVSACFLKNVSGSKVLAIEPQPQVLDLLKSNLSRFPNDRFEIFPFALSDRDEDAWLEINSTNRGASQLVSQQSAYTARVEVRSAGKLFASNSFRKLDLVKIDAELHEEQIIRSSLKEFERLQPRAILFEETGSKSAPNGTIGTMLTGIGYRVFGIRKFLTKVALAPILSEVDCTYNDYLAVSVTRSMPLIAAQIYDLK